MKNKIELPLVEPLYSTYLGQSAGSAILLQNPSVKNWYYEHVLIPICNRKFQQGYTTPEFNIVDSAYDNNPYIERSVAQIRLVDHFLDDIICNFIQSGRYVFFNGIDDFYVEGKSWYHEKHSPHDGTICGYNLEDKTYCIYAYDKNWVLQKFWTPIESFNKGKDAGYRESNCGYICGIKPMEANVIFHADKAIENLKTYLDSDFEKYPLDGSGAVAGIVVQDYLALYVGKLYDKTIPAERMDRRILRLLWEHKKVLNETVKGIEQAFDLDNTISTKYKGIVEDANSLRMQYAAFNFRKRYSILPFIQNKLTSLGERERVLLTNLLGKI